MKVFLTGGTGLVGSHVAERLLGEGHDVRALVRATGDASHLREVGAQLKEGDITRPESLAGALQGCEALVHAAAAVTVEAAWEVYREVNVEGTENVLRAAVEQGVRRAVHVSTVAVYGGAEEVAWRFHREGQLELSIVRPDVVYGERDRAALPRLARYASLPVVFTVGDGLSELPLVYAGNVAKGIVRALSSSHAAGRVYNLATDFPISQRELFELLAEELGRRPRFVPLPVGLATGAAWGIERLARLRGLQRPVVSRRHIAFMGRGNPFVSERAREELPWEPEVGHAEGVRRAVEWYQRDRAAKPG